MAPRRVIAAITDEATFHSWDFDAETCRANSYQIHLEINRNVTRKIDTLFAQQLTMTRAKIAPNEDSKRPGIRNDVGGVPASKGIGCAANIERMAIDRTYIASIKMKADGWF